MPWLKVARRVFGRKIPGTRVARVIVNRIAIAFRNRVAIHICRSGNRIWYNGIFTVQYIGNLQTPGYSYFFTFHHLFNVRSALKVGVASLEKRNEGSVSASYIGLPENSS